MKKVVFILVVLAVAVGIGYFVISNPLGRLVKLAVENFGPQMMQAAVSVKSVDISAKNGEGKIRGLHLGNPAGYKTDHALNADNIEIGIEPASIATDVVVLHKLLIDSPNIVYEKIDSGSNFDAIQRNVDAYLGKNGKNGNSEKGGAGKKMIIDSFVIRNARINYRGKLEIPLPDIELHNIGRNSGGATPAQITRAIITQLNTKLVLALAKTAVISGVGGPVVGAGMLLKSLLGK